MERLDSRKNRILKAIVHDYVETAEPIGSEWLASRHDFGCKSATLRNEMAEMSEWGYLVQPHTSAGRIPSQQGYRYYVDCLMPAPGLEDLSPIGADELSRMEVGELVQLTCRALARLTQYPCVATAPPVQVHHLHRLYLSPATPRQLLLVALLSTGSVEHRIMMVEDMPSDNQLQRATLLLNQRLSGLDLGEIGQVDPEGIPGSASLRSLIKCAFDGLLSIFRAISDDRIYLEGATHILRQREFHDVLRLEQLLAVLEVRSVLAQVFPQFEKSGELTVIIGTEAPLEAMADCSVVCSPYLIAGKAGGVIGVVGPTRMQYHRAVSAVGLMAQSLTDMLAQASIE